MNRDGKRGYSYFHVHPKPVKPKRVQCWNNSWNLPRALDTLLLAIETSQRMLTDMFPRLKSLYVFGNINALFHEVD
jgi:hypothetical protein